MLRNAGSRMRRIGAWLVLAVLAGPLLAGCASRPGVEALTAVGSTVPGASQHVILVASSRARDPRPGVFYSGDRTTALSFARIDMSVPPTHKPGMTEWPQQATPNPATDMVVREAVYRETEGQFVGDLRSELGRRPAGQRIVFIFVHGYNTLFSEALYRLTQMAEDSKSTAVPVLFTWASRGSTTDYVYDTNSATAARDRLEETIRLAFDSGAERVSILAHSMGNWVTVEALRQIRISAKGIPQDRLGNIILASPDIDVDVFKTQLKRFGKPQKPFIVIISHDDKALAFSDFIAGDKPRLGAYSNDAELVELGAVVVDMTGVKALDGFNHGKFAQLAEMAPELRGILARSGAERAPTAQLAGIQFLGLDRLRLAGAAVPQPASVTRPPRGNVAGGGEVIEEAAAPASDIDDVVP